MSRALVIIPTFDHGETLRPAIHSALRQTEQDVQVVVIGDEAPASTTALMDEICDGDRRVTYRLFPKSPRTGEPYRHEVLQSADAEFVFYLSDDDVWTPDHIELLSGALHDHDLAVSLSTAILDEGRLNVSTLDLSDPLGRELERGPVSRVSLTEMSHRLDAYHRLPFGWRTTPKGTYTDHHMYRQWLEQPWVRAITVPVWTQMHLPHSHFGMLTAPERVRMQWEWWERFQEPSWVIERQQTVVRSLLRQGSAVERHWETEVQRLPAEADAQLRAELDRQHAELSAGHAAALAATTAAADAQQHRSSELEREIGRLGQELDRMRASMTWRYGQRLAQLVGYGRLHARRSRPR